MEFAMKLIQIMLMLSILLDVGILAQYIERPYGDICKVHSVGKIRGTEFTMEEPLYVGATFSFYPLRKEHASWRMYIYHKGTLFKIFVRNGGTHFLEYCNEHGVMCNQIKDTGLANTKKINIMPLEWNRVLVTKMEIDVIKILIGSQAEITIPLKNMPSFSSKSDTWKFGFMFDRFHEKPDKEQMYLVQFMCQDYIELEQFSPDISVSDKRISNSGRTVYQSKPGIKTGHGNGDDSYLTRKFDNCTIFNIGKENRYVKTEEQPFYSGARLAFYPLTYTHRSWGLQISLELVLYKITISHGLHLKVQRCFGTSCITEKEGSLQEKPPTKTLTPIKSRNKVLHIYEPNPTDDSTTKSAYDKIAENNLQDKEMPRILPKMWNNIYVEIENHMITIFVSSRNLTSISYPKELHFVDSHWSFVFIPEGDYQVLQAEYAYQVQFMCAEYEDTQFHENDDTTPSYSPTKEPGVNGKGPSYTYTDTVTGKQEEEVSNTSTILLVVLLITGCLLFIGISYFVYTKIKARNSMKITDTTKLQMDKK